MAPRKPGAKPQVVLDSGKGGFLGRNGPGRRPSGVVRRLHPGLALMGLGLPFSPVEDGILHSESSSLSESGASHDNGEDLWLPHPPLL